MVLMLVMGCGRNDADSAVSLPPDPSVVNTTLGLVQGVATLDKRHFAGIPYAAPPVGPLRWQPPQPAVPWTGVRDATKVGPRCVQDEGGDVEMGRQTDEDCLTLNVWTPPPTGEARPVMVWLHGGAFINGNGAMYDSRWFVDRGDIIVVTVNYRLGALGFLAHPALGPPGSVGNYGLADQQAALRWVHENIAAFGGDPDKVTIAGESAGGMSVCDHLVAPESRGLFRAAIIQSAPCQAQLALPEAERISEAYARDVGCGDPATVAACLRALPEYKLRNPVWYDRIGEDTLSGPVHGTTVLPEDPMVALREGRGADVPVLIGSNRDEFTLFTALQYLRGARQYTPGEYPDLLADTFGADAAAVGARYPLDRYEGNAASAYAAAVTDGVFACVADRMAAELATVNDVYAYEFNDPHPPTPEPMRNLPFPVGASHSLELRYLFDVGGAPPLDPAQQELSNQMIDYWAHFVKTGAPAAEGAPDWPAVSGSGPWMSLRPDGSRVVTDFDRAHQCDFWAGKGGR
ncbi:carboxylesterase/lipase family protein [Mycobacterium sp. AMU20-3851]|uniref:carboxylesterase/lipase family protein n=1 Tax=Mycobacterium sp. AMU20-3851 TaxID=3122055 RepID=UPI0037548799